MKNKVSIIIPAYNSGKTLNKCIMSIIGQSYKNIEVIVVNDGSVDNTAVIVENLKKKDNRIKLITVPNGGVSHARNVGIDNATGEYITFVDSDDTVDIDMYKTLVEVLENNKADIAHCSYKNIYCDGSVSIVGGSGKIVSQSRDEALVCLISGKLFSGGLWNKLYRKELFESLKLEENIKFCEDVLMNFRLFSKANMTVYVDEAFYNYFQNLQSATHTANGEKSSRDLYAVSLAIMADSKGTVYEKYAVKKLADSELGLFEMYVRKKDKSLKREKYESLNRVKEWKKAGLYSRNQRIKLFLLEMIPFAYHTIYKIHDRFRVKKLDPDQSV